MCVWNDENVECRCSRMETFVNETWIMQHSLNWLPNGTRIHLGQDVDPLALLGWQKMRYLFEGHCKELLPLFHGIWRLIYIWSQSLEHSRVKYWSRNHIGELHCPLILPHPCSSGQNVSSHLTFFKSFANLHQCRYVHLGDSPRPASIDPTWKSQTPVNHAASIAW